MTKLTLQVSFSRKVASKLIKIIHLISDAIKLLRNETLTPTYYMIHMADSSQKSYCKSKNKMTFNLQLLQLAQPSLSLDLLCVG